MFSNKTFTFTGYDVIKDNHGNHHYLIWLESQVKVGKTTYVKIDNIVCAELPSKEEVRVGSKVYVDFKASKIKKV